MSYDTELLASKTRLNENLFVRGKLYAKALLKESVFLAKPFKLPDGGRIYCDIETNLANDFVWLIGVLYESQIGKNIFKQFLALTREKEQRLITDFISLLKKFKGAFIYNSGCYFEERALQQRIEELTPNFSRIFGG